MVENKKNEIAITVGNRVRSIRRSKGLTIEQLACDIGVEYTQLSRIERGRINTSIFNLFLITKALNTSFSELVKDLDEVEFDLLGQ
jgi:transcriptional regulator with XRE-family HTH domain